MGKAVMMQALLQAGGRGVGRRIPIKLQGGGAATRRGRARGAADEPISCTVGNPLARIGTAPLVEGNGGGGGGGSDVEQRKQPTRPPSDNVNHEATRGKNWRVRGHPIPEDPHESDTYMSRYRAGQARTALGHRAPRAEREARSGPCASVSGPGPAPSSAPSSAPSTMVRNSRIETPRRRGPGGAGGRKPARRPQTGGQETGGQGYFTLAGQGIGRLSPGGRGAFSHSSVNRSWTGGQSYLRPSRRPLSIAAPRRAGARRARSRESARPMSGIISFPERRRRRSRSGPDILRRAPGRACAMVAPRLERPHP